MRTMRKLSRKELEERVLSACLLSNSCIELYRDKVGLEPSDFRDKQNQCIWSAMIDMYGKQEVDIINLVIQLEKNQVVFDRTALRDKLLEITETFMDESVPYYAHEGALFYAVLIKKQD